MIGKCEYEEGEQGTDVSQDVTGVQETETGDCRGGKSGQDRYTTLIRLNNFTLVAHVINQMMET